MPTFTPPSRAAIPPLLADRNEMAPGAFSLRQHYRAQQEGINVYMYKLGSVSYLAEGRVTETDPSSHYDSAGVLSSDGWQDIEIVFWGGHNAVTVTAEQAAALQAAGYTVV